MFDVRPHTADELGLVPAWRGPLWVTGILPPAPRVAVVGSRAVRRDLLRCVDPVVDALGAAGASVVSGGALGVDAAVHRRALISAVPQIAVLPGPPDSPYPPDHAPLFADIAAQGALVFLHPAGTPYARAMFASRNRVVVGLADYLVVIAAGLRSGTSLTVGLARRRGRPIAALTGSPGGAACIAEGAVSLGGPDTSAEELAEAVRRFLAGVASGVQAWPVHLQPVEDVLVAAGSRGATVDDFADPLGAMVGLAEAEGAGLVSQRAPGIYVLSSPRRPR